MPEVHSSRAVGRPKRATARFAIWLSRRAPRLYLRWAAAGNAGWRGDRPWTPIEKPLAESRVALVSSGGIVLADQQPFDLSDPGGDCSYRVIPADADLRDALVSHLFYEPREASADAGVMLPLPALHALAGQGVIGTVAPRHFSFSGSIPDPAELVATYAPEVARMMASDEVDLALLTPA